MLTQKEIKQLYPLLTTENYTNFINDIWIPITTIYQNIFCRKEFLLHKHLFYKYICSRNIIDSYFRKMIWNNYKDDYVPISYYFKQFDNIYSCKFTESFCRYYDSMILYFKYASLVDCGVTKNFHFQIQYHFNVQRIILTTFCDSQDIRSSVIISFGDKSDDKSVDIFNETKRLEESHMLNGSYRGPYYFNDVNIIKVDKPLFNEDDMSIIRKIWMTIQFWLATKIHYRKEKSLYIPECLNINAENLTSVEYPFLYDANNKLFNYFITNITRRENFYHFDKLLLNMILKCIDRQKDNINEVLFPLFKCYQFNDIFEQQPPEDNYESD